MGRHASGDRRSLAVAAMGLVLCVLLAGCSAPWSGIGTAGGGVPNGWQVGKLPSGDNAITYAVSPDVAGLVLACAGTVSTEVSAAPPGPAALYRSRDGGATWQAIQAPPDLHAGCALAAPAGGNGTFFLINYFGSGSTADEYIAVTHDAGATWHAVMSLTSPTDTTTDLAIKDLFDLVARDGAVYQGSALYGLPRGSSATAQYGTFASSQDDGATWQVVQSGPDADTGGQLAPLALAADPSVTAAAGGWYRLSTRVSAGADGKLQPTPLRLEHSTDGGKTWQVVSSVGPLGMQPRYSSSIVTSAAHPNRICVAVSSEDLQSASGSAKPNPSASPSASPAGGTTATPTTPPSNSMARGAALPGGGAGLATMLGALTTAHTAQPAGPPRAIPHHDGLYASSDGGKTWSGAVIGNHPSDWGNLASGVAMGADGSCYALDSVIGFGSSSANVSTLWRLAPGGKHPARVTQFSGYTPALFAVMPAGKQIDSRLEIAFNTSSQNSACILSTDCSGQPQYLASVTQLAWRATP